jgi:hypothetical protein
VDGFLVLAAVRDASVRLTPRNGHSFTNALKRKFLGSTGHMLCYPFSASACSMACSSVIARPYAQAVIGSGNPRERPSTTQIEERVHPLNRNLEAQLSNPLGKNSWVIVDFHDRKYPAIG